MSSIFRKVKGIVSGQREKAEAGGGLYRSSLFPWLLMMPTLAVLGLIGLFPFGYALYLTRLPQLSKKIEVFSNGPTTETLYLG